MSVRDIIEAATPREGAWERGGLDDYTIRDGSGRTSDAADVLYVNDEREDWSEVGGDPYFVPPKATAAFIVTFDPEHVALMEDERKALRHFVANYDDFAHHPEFRAVLAAMKRSDDYRRERGLL